MTFDMKKYLKEDHIQLGEAGNTVGGRKFGAHRNDSQELSRADAGLIVKLINMPNNLQCTQVAIEQVLGNGAKGAVKDAMKLLDHAEQQIKKMRAIISKMSM